METEAEGDLQILTTIPFLINLGQVTVVPASIKWPSESSQRKNNNNQLPSMELCWMPQKAGNSNVKNSAPVFGLRIHGRGIKTCFYSEHKIGHLMITQVIRESGGDLSVSLTYNKFLSKHPGKDRSPRAFPWPNTGHGPHTGNTFTSLAGCKSWIPNNSSPNES